MDIYLVHGEVKYCWQVLSPIAMIAVDRTFKIS